MAGTYGEDRVKLFELELEFEIEPTMSVRAQLVPTVIARSAATKQSAVVENQMLISILAESRTVSKPKYLAKLDVSSRAASSNRH